MDADLLLENIYCTMLVWWAGQVGDLPWTRALLCGGSALVLWCLTRIPPLLLLIPYHPGLHTLQGPSKSLDPLSVQTNSPQPWKYHLPMFPACWVKGSRE